MIRRLAVLAAVALAMPVIADQTRQRYTIVTNPDAPRPARLHRLTSSAEEKIARRVRSYRNVSGFAADLTPAEAEELRKSGVISVEPVVERHAAAIGRVSADYESYEQQVVPWGLPVTRLPEVWPVTRGEGINVAVLDTGIDWNHPDLQAAYQGGVNILDETKLPVDDNKHGTHVAGIIAATDNGFGVVGGAPGVKLWNVKVLDSQGKGYDEYTAAGIDWVVEQQRLWGGRWVINMSLGSAALGGKLEGLAVQRAYEAGVILVASAGNRSQDWLDYPAAYPGVIAVGAVGEDGEKAEFSSYGGGMPVVAPGVLVQSTFIEGLEQIAEVAPAGATPATARGVIGAPYGVVTGKLVHSGYGAVGEFPAGVAGNIALIQRGGDLEFREKARNAKGAGAAAVVIWNNDTTDPRPPLWTLTPQGCPNEDTCPDEWKNYVFPVTVGVANTEGLELVAQTGKNTTVTFLSQRYGRLSGTSMAAPHVAATAALLLSLDPTMNPSGVLFVIRHTARDTSKPGWDFQTSWGIVDALAAAQFVAPDRFQVPPPNYTSPRRRATRP